MTPATKTRGPLVETVPWRLVTTNRNEFKRKILGDLEAGVKAIILDCTRTSHIDSSALGVLFTLNKTAIACGAQLVLVGCSADIEELLRLTRLDGVFARAASVADAKRMLGCDA